MKLGLKFVFLILFLLVAWSVIFSYIFLGAPFWTRLPPPTDSIVMYSCVGYLVLWMLIALRQLKF